MLSVEKSKAFHAKTQSREENTVTVPARRPLRDLCAFASLRALFNFYGEENE
jgi:hypothetical protein